MVLSQLGSECLLHLLAPVWFRDSGPERIRAKARSVPVSPLVAKCLAHTKDGPATCIPTTVIDFS